MNLYLVQHGLAMPEEEDSARPLSDKGRNDVRKVASFVSSHIINRIDNFMHSGKTRAQQSAQIMAEVLNPLAEVKEGDGLNPEDEPGVWLERLDDSNEDHMLVGHLPHLSRLAGLLVCGDKEKKVVNFQNGGIVALFRDQDRKWAVQWVVIPDLL
jgi:phosphohistidine phosphatase